MSSFLGPIHFWLYEKIKFQENLTTFIFDECTGLLSDDEVKELSSIVKREIAPLDELVDTMNIHGWLQERIGDAESRYARLVTYISSKGDKYLSAVKKNAFDFGKKNGVKADSARDFYKAFDDALLNGMPCDRVCVVLTSDENRFEWQFSEDIHKKFWDDDGALYYELRLEVMRGMLDGSGFDVKNSSALCYEIIRT